MIHKNMYGKFIIITTLLCFVLASVFHFVYEWTGELKVVGFIFPVNESVWEHLKLNFYPLLLVWNIPWNKLFTKFLPLSFSLHEKIIGIGISTLIAMSITLFGFYGLAYGFLIEGLIIDLILIFISFVVGQLIAILVMKAKPAKFIVILLAIWVIMCIIFLAIFSFYQPNLPVFEIHEW